MGGKNSIHIYNSTSFTAKVKSEYLYTSGVAYPKQTFSFEDTKNKLKNGKLIIIRVDLVDSTEKVLKTVDFKSGKDQSWIIKEEGIKRQLYGKALWVEDPKGKCFPFQDPLPVTSTSAQSQTLLVTSSGNDAKPSTPRNRHPPSKSNRPQLRANSIAGVPEAFFKEITVLIAIIIAVILIRIIFAYI